MQIEYDFTVQESPEYNFTAEDNPTYDFTPSNAINITGTSDYNDLDNKPSINGNTLEGDKTPEELGIEIPELVTDLGVVDPEPYDDDVNVYLNTLTESGWYKFFWDSGDDYSYFTQVQAITYGGVIYVNQHCWGLEESPITEFIRGFIVEDGEVILEDSTSYMTFDTASNTFASKTHQHYRTDAKAVSVWDFCNTVANQNANPLVIYFDLSTNKTYLIETYVGTRQPVYKMQKVTEMNDISYFCQRSSYYYSGREHWGDWYKFTGTAFTPSTSR